MPVCYNYIGKDGNIMADSPLIIKSKEFALQIIKVCNYVKQTKKETLRHFLALNSSGGNDYYTGLKSKHLFLKQNQVLTLLKTQLHHSDCNQVQCIFFLKHSCHNG